MACGGPSKEFAVIKSQEAFDDIIRLLKEKYYVSRPESNWGPATWRDDWEEEESALREILADMFWTSDASNF